MALPTTYFTAEELERLPDGDYEVEEFDSITVEGKTVDFGTRYKVRRAAGDGSGACVLLAHRDLLDVEERPVAPFDVLAEQVNAASDGGHDSQFGNFDVPG